MKRVTNNKPFYMLAPLLPISRPATTTGLRPSAQPSLPRSARTLSATSPPPSTWPFLLLKRYTKGHQLPDRGACRRYDQAEEDAGSRSGDGPCPARTGLGAAVCRRHEPGKGEGYTGRADAGRYRRLYDVRGLLRYQDCEPVFQVLISNILFSWFAQVPDWSSNS